MNHRSTVFVLAAALSGGVYAANTIPCSTGFATATASGCGVPISSPAAATLLADGNWYVSSNSSGTFQSQAFVTINNAFPVQNAGPWLANNAALVNGKDTGSAWLVASTNQAAVFTNLTTTYFSTTFSVSDAASESITGKWLADDYAAGIFLNGVAVNEASYPAFGGESGSMVAFTITQGNPALGQAVFINGINIITFGVVNDNTNHGTVAGSGTSSSGLRVEFNAAAVPEPQTYGLMLAGLGVLLVAVRLRKMG